MAKSLESKLFPAAVWGDREEVDDLIRKIDEEFVAYGEDSGSSISSLRKAINFLTERLDSFERSIRD